MSGRWLLLPAVLVAGCLGRAWNYDETDRITAVMARDSGAFDPAAGVPFHDMPPLGRTPYGGPVFVGDLEDGRRRQSRRRSAPRAPPSAKDEARDRAERGERERSKAQRERTHRAGADR